MKTISGARPCDRDRVDRDRRRFLQVMMTMAATHGCSFGAIGQGSTRGLAAIERAREWLDGPHLRSEALGHKVVLVQQPLDEPPRLLVPTLPKVTVANATSRLHKVKRRPVGVFERSPDGVVVVEHDRIVDPHLPQGGTNVLDIMLERELRRVNVDDVDVLSISLGPRAHVRKGAQPVDARVSSSASTAPPTSMSTNAVRVCARS
jgi:hypothetical protein